MQGYKKAYLKKHVPPGTRVMSIPGTSIRFGTVLRHWPGATGYVHVEWEGKYWYPKKIKIQDLMFRWNGLDEMLKVAFGEE